MGSRTGQHRPDLLQLIIGILCQSCFNFQIFFFGNVTVFTSQINVGFLLLRSAAGSGLLVAGHGQVQAPCEAETGNGHERRSAKQAHRDCVLGYEGARRKRLAEINARAGRNDRSASRLETDYDAQLRRRCHVRLWGVIPRHAPEPDRPSTQHATKGSRYLGQSQKL